MIKESALRETGALDVALRKPSAGSPYSYCVYGIVVHSEIPLALPARGDGELGEIELRVAPASYFSDISRGMRLQQDSGSFYQYARLPDGSSYVRWEEVGEFLISANGRRISARQFDETHGESFQVYLLGQALSFALVKQGFEPLHATTVVINGEAAVLLGESGFGKSSLAASFIEAGHRMLTDDLLILQRFRGKFLAYPGPPRIKLFPKSARRFLRTAAIGVAMNSWTKKLVLPLDRTQSSAIPVPVKAIYTLAGPRQVCRNQQIRVTVLSPRESFMELVKNTFNYRIVNPDRLQRQFEETAEVVSTAPVKRISYPRVLAHIPAVRDAILADLRAINERAACGD
jgi:hypothetical protein